ncbi:ABC transporter ATP-binding protein [Bailinhaonella thermotolerans]|uniref:ABC transporter ATP-binding protein n=1 Tax=Bailinhaonella thermotolerans TaxID=1070861 RepID=A0A3A4AZE1_9ACTN|nr:ABC transporter ATP-binding protein [Bailinhaonella thermotolerans]RJL31213.1 ABC transporter ATP-binding protein [Bailinhaonella thermotolerans]
MHLAQAEHVTCRFGAVTALDRVSVEIPEGQFLGLLGPNGAGKSTLINLFAGLRRPTSGRVRLGGRDPRHPAARRHTGTTPQETGLPAALRVGECVDFVAAHYPDPMPRGELLERFGLTGLERRQTGGLSGGQRRRLAVALAFAGRPRLVFLDEPTTGLDVEARHALWEGVRAYHAEGGTVVLTSHYLEEVEALAERVLILDRGRVVRDGTVEDIRDAVRIRRVTLRGVFPLPPLSGLAGLEQEGDVTTLLTADVDALVRELVAAGVPLADLRVDAGSLEDAFLAITRAESEGIS